MSQLEETILALDRTQRDLSDTSGRCLRTQLSRQVEAGRRELSVIVQSPTTSTPDPTLVTEEHPPSFFSAENSAIQPPEYLSITTPFQIYEDPEQLQSGRPSIIVTTPSASISVGKENIEPEFLDSNIMTNNQDAIIKDQELSDRLKKAQAKLRSKMEVFNPEKYPPAVLKMNQDKWQGTIMEDYSELCLIIDEIREITEAEEDKVKIKEGYDVWTTLLNNFFLSYSNKLLTVGDEGSSSTPSTSSQDSSSRRAAVASVKVDTEKLTLDIKALSSEIRNVDDWSSADSSEVETAMHKVESWKKQFKDIRNTLFSIKKLVMTHSITGVNLSGSETDVFNLEAEMELIIENIQHEDDVRDLYSLSKSKAADVKYPQFSGCDDEDYNKFEREFLAALKSNKVKQVDKIKKLRECLKGQPKSLINENLEDIDEGLKILQTVYGDPSRVMKSKKNKLLSLGNFPKFGSKTPSHLKQQFDWLLQLELLLADVIDLATKSNDMHCEIYNPTFYRTIKQYFPTQMMKEMSGFTGDTKQRIASMKEYVVTNRKETQTMLQDVDVGGVAVNSGSNEKAKTSPSSLYSSFTAATRYEECKICKVLEDDGDYEDLYDDHFGKTPFGCPRFASMTCGTRLQMVYRTKICQFCLDPNYVHKRRGERHRNCPAFSSSGSFKHSCNSCKYHYLICERHMEENEEKLEQSRTFWSEQGKYFSNSVSMLSSASSNRRMSRQSPSSRSPSVYFHKSAIDAATKKLKRFVSEGTKIDPDPEGEPMFMFSYIQGKTKSLNVFYDRGCSHSMFKTGVPEVELDAVKICSGPKYVNTAGNKTIKVGDKWACLVDKVDGSKQVIVGVDCQDITFPFPMMSTKEAYKEILAKAPRKRKGYISSLKVPDIIGGSPDILMGIKYESVHPRTVFTLPSGLFIAKLKLASHSGWTACIGGPHKSFASLAAQSGGTARLLSCFIDSIDNFHKLGAPKLPVPMMSIEDIEFLNKSKISDISGQETKEENMPEHSSDEPPPSNLGDGAAEECMGFPDASKVVSSHPGEDGGRQEADLPDKSIDVENFKAHSSNKPAQSKFGDGAAEECMGFPNASNAVSSHHTDSSNLYNSKTHSSDKPALSILGDGATEECIGISEDSIVVSDSVGEDGVRICSQNPQQHHVQQIIFNMFGESKTLEIINLMKKFLPSTQSMSFWEQSILAAIMLNCLHSIAGTYVEIIGKNATDNNEMFYEKPDDSARDNKASPKFPGEVNDPELDHVVTKLPVLASSSNILSQPPILQTFIRGELKFHAKVITHHRQYLLLLIQDVTVCFKDSGTEPSEIT